MIKMEIMMQYVQFLESIIQEEEVDLGWYCPFVKQSSASFDFNIDENEDLDVEFLMRRLQMVQKLRELSNEDMDEYILNNIQVPNILLREAFECFKKLGYNKCLSFVINKASGSL